MANHTSTYIFGFEALAGLVGVPVPAEVLNPFISSHMAASDLNFQLICSMNQKVHYPPHLYIDDTWYTLTVSTYRQIPIFRPSSHKELLREQIKEMAKEFQLTLRAWVILDNHYHLLSKTHLGEDLVKFFRRVHGRTSFEVNGLDETRGRQVWHNYWDTCIRSEKDYWTRFNYIHHNPVKHGYVDKVGDWAFSSYPYYLRTRGSDWLNDVWMKYPIVDFTDPRDEFSLPG